MFIPLNEASKREMRAVAERNREWLRQAMEDQAMASRVVRCKMSLVERQEYRVYGDKVLVGLKFQVVTASDKSEEDRRFHDATPTGSLEFGTVNYAAANGLEIGKTYYVDVLEADE